MSTIPSGFFARGIVFVLTRPFHLFVGTEARGALLLLVATVAALVWVNSPWGASYETLWSTRLSVQVGEAELAKDLRHWVNDGLMVLFFLVVGLELSRQLKLGELRHWQTAAVPAVAALGGMVVPALLYLTFNPSGPAARGWAIVMAGDLALVLGVLALVGPRCPPQLRVLLLTLVLVGDIAAVAVVGLLYAEVVNILALAVVVVVVVVVVEPPASLLSSCSSTPPWCREPCRVGVAVLAGILPWAPAVTHLATGGPDSPGAEKAKHGSDNSGAALLDAGVDRGLLVGQERRQPVGRHGEVCDPDGKQHEPDHDQRDRDHAGGCA